MENKKKNPTEEGKRQAGIVLMLTVFLFILIYWKFDFDTNILVDQV
jgi:hypothetical protein